ncbi:hypothetical protein DV702_15235 [Sporosarcina sp. PTS2304]|uniref:hypothetical protein n=1 Tax=Sporosarcina sp. PTS2304 TaxID=2283194 RepID=UPI000E0E0909|nr:hypothetical protein [Sporosarcina sp. PTS2304]AXI00944.1 hypothetical protein DV702_15235 [Sporosarcina sp. PTS2304]
MRILWHELKKILTLKMMLLLVIVNSLLFFLLIEFDITHFPNGRPGLDSYRIGIEMIEKYGTHMDEAEFVDFKNVYEEEVKKADQYLQSRQAFVDADMDTYEKLVNYDWDNETDVQRDLRNELFHEQQVDLFWELQERRSLLDFHDSKESSLDWFLENPTVQQQARIDEMKEQKLYQVYTDVVYDNYKNFIRSVAITILLSVVIVISPIFLKDRSQRLLDLQYTSKKGRNLYKTKVLAGSLSTFLVITALLLIYFRIYALNDTAMFFDVPVHMFIASNSWYDPTFFQYIMLTILAIYALGFVFALLAMVFSSIVPNMISLIGVQIPFIVSMISYGLKVLLVGMIAFYTAKWVVPTLYGVMIVLSCIAMILMWLREKKRDVLV